MPSTTGMKGEGFYDSHSGAQGAVADTLRGWIAEAAGSLASPTAPLPLTLVDFGSSEGRNAIAALRVAAEAVRQHTAHPIQMVFSDLASNNFNQLFTNLNAAEGFPPQVFTAAAAGSFYRPLLPPGTVHLQTCFNALLWLDRLPAPVPDFVVYRRPYNLVVPPERVAAFEAQARTDLIRFLEARAAELAPGGKLLIAGPGDDEQGRCSDGLYDVLNDAALDFVSSGRIPRDRYERLTVPVYFRTLEELLEPLRAKDSPVADMLEVIRADTSVVPTPFEVELRRGGDTATYARAYTGFLRAFSEPIIRAALLEPGDDAALVDDLFERIRVRVEADPRRYHFRFVLVAVCLARR